MPQWLSELLEKSSYFMPHGHCYLWIPSLLWLHVISDLLIGFAYLGISLLLYLLVRKIRLPFSPVFIAFGLFIGLCGLTHFMNVWTVWNPDYFVDGLVKAATAAASVATAFSLIFVRPQVEEVVHTARLSEERRIQLESTNTELEALYKRVKELNELKTQFFANVSHELRTPLALMLGPAERLLSDPQLTPAQRKQLESIRSNGKSLLKQVNDLLDVAKLDAGKLQLHYVRMDVVPWLRRVTSQFEVAAEQRHIDYELTTPESLVAEVDPEMLERVVVNLLGNAFKFTPEQGRIQVRLHANGDEVQLAVQDNGPGISSEQQQVIFERFRQGDGGATRQHGGTGLGLAIVKELIDLHRGEVKVTSSLGAGAQFEIRLPLHAPQTATVTSVAHAPSSITELTVDAVLKEISSNSAPHALRSTHAPDKPTVLVVEDNRDMRDFIAGTLSDDYNVCLAADGVEGLQQALALKPDLIVTDIMMPKMSGDQLVAEVRARPELNQSPILLLTAKADEDHKVELLRQGAQDYLLKPFRPQELLARAANLITAKRAADTLRAQLTGASGDLATLAQALARKHQELQTLLDTAEVAKAQAEHASLVKSQFLGLVSHELRTPLSTIHSNAQFLARIAMESLPEVFQRCVVRLTRATQHLTTLVESLLQYVRVEGGKIEVQPEAVDVVALAERVIEMHKEHVAPEVQLQLAPDPSAAAPVITDPRLLNVVLNNLISNALKFTNEGTVTVRVRRSDAWQVMEVHDTGLGISESEIGRIFLPFEQLEPVKRKHIPGVGLGLALVKQIVELLQGRVEVESRQGEGSTFRVLLPVSA